MLRVIQRLCAPELEAESGHSLHIFPDESGKLLVLLDTLTTEMLPIDYMKLEKELESRKTKNQSLAHMVRTVASSK